jgi:hypothetical protein
MTEPLIHDPGNDRRIDELFVFMSIDDKGKHGIVAEMIPGLGTTPLVTASPKGVERMKKLAQDVAKRTGKPVGLFAFMRVAQLWQTDE